MSEVTGASAGTRRASARRAALPALCLAALTLLLPAGAAAAPTWLLPPLDLSAAGEDAFQPHVGLDPQGNAVAIWVRSDGANLRIEAATRPPGGTFGGPQLLSAAGQSASEPQLALDPQGSAVAVWRRDDGANFRVEAATRPPAGFFGAPQLLSAAGQNAFEPQLALDAQGNAVAIWTRSDGANFRVEASARPPGGTFGVPQLLSAAGEDALEQQVAIDPQGNAVAIWLRSDGANDRVEAASRPPGGFFGVPQLLSAPGQDASEPQVALDAQGNAVAVWRRFDGASFRVEAATRAPGGFFGASQLLSVSAPGQNAFEPQVALDPQGNALAIWGRSDGANNRIQAAPYDAAGPLLRELRIPASGAVGEPLSFSVSPLDVWSPLGGVQWSFGDGAGAFGAAATHAYAAPGSYPVTLTASDALGNASVATGTVAVSAAAVTPGASAPDTTRPRLRALELSPRRFRATWRRGAGKRRGKARKGGEASSSARRGARISYRLSEPARVRFRVERALPGRRAGRHCAKPKRANRKARRCTRWRTLRGAFAHSGRAGRNSLRFSGRLRGRRLAPGRYRLRAVAADAAGNASRPPRRAPFRIVRR